MRVSYLRFERADFAEILMQRAILKWKKGLDKWRSGYQKDLEEVLREFDRNSDIDELIRILGNNAKKSERRYQQAILSLGNFRPTGPFDAIGMFAPFYTMLELRRDETIRHPAFPDFVVALRSGLNSPQTAGICGELLQSIVGKLVEPDYFTSILKDLHKWGTFQGTEDVLQHYEWLRDQIDAIWKGTEKLNRRDEEREKRLKKLFGKFSPSRKVLSRRGRWTPSPIAVEILSRVYGRGASEVDRILAEARRIKKALATQKIEFAPDRDFEWLWDFYRGFDQLPPSEQKKLTAEVSS